MLRDITQRDMTPNMTHLHMRGMTHPHIYDVTYSAVGCCSTLPSHVA